MKNNTQQTQSTTAEFESLALDRTATDRQQLAMHFMASMISDFSAHELDPKAYTHVARKAIALADALLLELA